MLLPFGKTVYPPTHFNNSQLLFAPFDMLESLGRFSRCTSKNSNIEYFLQGIFCKVTLYVATLLRM